MARRNWIILFLLLALCSSFGTLEFVLSVLAGGLVTIFSYNRLQHSLTLLVNEPTRRMAKKALWTTLFKLVALTAFFVVLFATFEIHPIGLAVGLSVVVINLFWTTGSRLLSHKE